MYMYMYFFSFQVEEPEKYNFSPKTLLDLLTDIYLHLSDGDGLARAIVMDDRSYRKELFDHCIRILYNRGIKSKVSRYVHVHVLWFFSCCQEAIERFQGFVQKVEAEAVVCMREEIVISDVPDEFKGRGVHLHIVIIIITTHVYMYMYMIKQQLPSLLN